MRLSLRVRGFNTGFLLLQCERQGPLHDVQMFAYDILTFYLLHYLASVPAGYFSFQLTSVFKLYLQLFTYSFFYVLSP